MTSHRRRSVSSEWIKAQMRRPLVVSIGLALLISVALAVVFLAGGSPSKQIERAAIQIPMEEKTKTFSNPHLLNDAITFKPKRVEGAMVGCVVSRLGKDSIFRKAGFREGDLVKKVNEVRLDSLAQALTLKDELSTSNTFEVELGRDGQSKNLNFEFR